MDSPCINVCVMDTAAGLCTGCGRSLAEIAGWSGFTDRERARIMARLTARVRSGEVPAASIASPGKRVET